LSSINQVPCRSSRLHSYGRVRLRTVSRIIGVLAEFLLGIGNRNEREMKSLGRNEDETSGPVKPVLA
jgi:hypothetical protein